MKWLLPLMCDKVCKGLWYRLKILLWWWHNHHNFRKGVCVEGVPSHFFGFVQGRIHSPYPFLSPINTEADSERIKIFLGQIPVPFFSYDTVTETVQALSFALLTVVTLSNSMCISLRLKVPDMNILKN